MDKYYIPKQLDVPFKLILWTCDEVVLFSIPFLISFFMMNSPIVGIVSGALAVMILKKIKGEEGHYFLTHMAYWYLPPVVMYKVTPRSYIREYLG